MGTVASAFDPPTRTPIAYAYARVSHHDGFEKGDSISSQESRTKQYWEAQLKPLGVEWGSCENDGKNVSAFTTMFSSRPAGKKLLNAMQPGDHLILDKVDRIWRSLTDFTNLMRLLQNRKITIHIVNFLGGTIQSNTPLSEFTLRLFVLIAELESMIKAERTSEALSVTRAKGRRFGARVPPGCEMQPILDANGNQILNGRGRPTMMVQWDRMERDIMCYIVHLIDEDCRMWDQAYAMIESYIALATGRDIRPVSEQKMDRLTTWKRLYKYEVAYRYLNITEPRQIPKGNIISAAARQHKRLRSNERSTKTFGRKRSWIPEVPAEELLKLT